MASFNHRDLPGMLSDSEELDTPMRCLPTKGDREGGWGAEDGTSPIEDPALAAEFIARHGPADEQVSIGMGQPLISQGRTAASGVLAVAEILRDDRAGLEVHDLEPAAE